MDKLILCFIALSTLTGCARFDTQGTRHALIFGFGIVSFPTLSSAPVTVTKTQVIGLVLSDQVGIKVGAGYSSSVVTQIATNQHVQVEVNDGPLSPIKIESR